MRVAFRTAVLFVGFVVSGCSCERPYAGAALAVRIEIEDPLIASCIVLEVQDTTGTLLEKTQLTRVSGKKSYLVGIKQGTLPAEVLLRARAMNGTTGGCNGTLSAVFDGGAVLQAFVAGEVKPVTLTLSCTTRAETCDDGIDNNCNQLLDCAEPSCDAQTCPGGGSCQSSSCACPGGKKACNGTCILTTECCGDSACSAITGQSCQAGACACPAGQAACGSSCIPASACCTGAECLSIAGQTCQSGACACPMGQKICGTKCIPDGSCCTDPECAAQIPGQTCQTETCACPSGQRICAGSCLAGTGCCVNLDCGAGGTCATATGICSCGAGTKLCQGVCIPSGSCCAAADCTSPGVCKSAAGAICSSGTCTYQNATTGTACGSTDTTGCNAADSCDGAGSCLDRVKPVATVCRPAGSVAFCDPAETCDGISNACPANLHPGSTVACGSADNTACNAPDTCNGSGTCTFRFKSAVAICRAAGTSALCDPAEICSGTSLDCPNDVVATNSTACGSPNSTGCDAADLCDGAGACVNKLKAASFVCRPAGAIAVCDPAENCTGSSPTCPTDLFAPSTTACGSTTATGCNLADTCSGTGTCVDRVKPAATQCRAPGADPTCNPAELCDGIASACPADVHPTSTTPCDSADNTGCNAPDSCGGAGTCVARVKALNELCRPGGADLTCDPPEVCNGTTIVCPVNAVAPLATPCGSASSLECDEADSCDAIGTCVDRLKPVATECRAAASPICDPADYCTGLSPACPANALAPDGLVCGGGSTCQTGVCKTSFAYNPSNFNSNPLTPAGDLVMDCGVSVFDSSALTFTNWCGEVQPAPVVKTQSGGPDLVILPMLGLTVAGGSTLQIIGDKPVILAVYGNATLTGAVTADAVATTAGPGSSSIACGTSTGSDGSQVTTSGGGAGGAGFGTDGADGEVSATGGAKGTKGVLGGNTTLIALRGGCSGGQGGTGTAPGGLGGAGGGAVQISVAGLLTVGGRVSAVGGGGRGGASRTGGGGGGSGGAILLEGDSVLYTAGARISANGGGGGEGGDDGGGAGDFGDDGNGSAPGTAAAGGTGGANNGGNGGSGGRAGQGPNPGAVGDNVSGGGGAGGGAVGRVRVNARIGCSFTAGSVTSPAPTGNGATGCPSP